MGYDNLKTLIRSQSLVIDSEDHILHMILQWHSKNKSNLTELLELVNWSIISEDHLSYLY